MHFGTGFHIALHVRGRSPSGDNNRGADVVGWDVDKPIERVVGICMHPGCVLCLEQRYDVVKYSPSIPN